MKPETRKRKELAKELKHRVILNAAEAIIQKDGLDALSINKVAKRAKIAKGTVYLYFESKEEIIGGLTIRARKALLDYFKKYCEKQTDPIEKIKGIFWADYYFFKEQHTYHELVTFYEQNTGLTEKGELVKASMAISKYVSNIILDAKNKKVIHQDIDPGLQGFVFWGMVVGIIQIIDSKKDQLTKYFGKTPKEFYEYFVDNAIAGLRP